MALAGPGRHAAAGANKPRSEQTSRILRRTHQAIAEQRTRLPSSFTPPV